MGVRIFAAIAFLFSAGSIDSLAGQKPVVTVATLQSSVSENANTVTRTTSTTTLSKTPTTSGTFLFRSDVLLPSNLTVQYSVSGTALAGKDYQALSGSVVIPAGQTSASITVSPIDDSEDELDETVTVSILATLRSPYSTTRPSAARTTILDDDDVRILSAELSPDTVLGGLARDLRVTVSGAAPAGGLLVTVGSGNTAVVPHAEATIAAGTRVGIVRIATNAVQSSVDVGLRATEPNGSAFGTTLTVLKEPEARYASFKFWDNFGGRDFDGSISLDGPAPPGGLIVPVTLTVVSPAGAPLPVSAPSSVTLTAGQSSAWLTVTSQQVSVLTRVEVRAEAGGSSASQVLDIYPPPRVQTFTVLPDPVRGSDSVDVQIRLDQPIGPRVGYRLELSGTAPVDLTSPQRVTIPYGQQEAAVRVGTIAVAEPTVATLVSNPVDPQQGVSASTSFEVTPPEPRGVYFRFWDNYGGRDYYGTVGIDGPAPAGGLTVPVSLKVLTPAGASLPATAPATVTVGAGSTAGSIILSTQPVSTFTQVEVRAGSGTTSAASTIDIYPVPQVQSLTVSPDPASSSGSVDISVQLDQDVGPRLGHNVYLSGSGPVSLSPYTRLHIQKGNREGTLRVSTDAVTGPTTANVNATNERNVPGPWNTSFTVAPLAPLPAVATVAFNNASVIGGTSVPVTVVLTGAVPAGRSLFLTLTATDPVIQPANTTLTIPAGEAVGTLTVQTRAVTQLTEGSLRAEAAGGAAVTGTVAVLPPPPTLDALSLNPARVLGGDPATPVNATLSLSGAAPIGGMVVNLSSSEPQAAAVPASITVPAGASVANFQVSTSVVASAVDVRITATTSTQRISQTVRVDPVPPRLASLTFNAVSVEAGTALVGQVDLAAPVGAPTTVLLSTSNSAAATVPASVSIPAGQTAATFQLAGGPVSTSTSVQVTARLGTDQSSASVTVEPAPPAVEISSLVIDPAAGVIGGAEVAITVTLNMSAPTGFNSTIVGLQSSDLSILPLPGGLSFAPGSQSQTLAVRADAVATGTRVTVIASLGGDQEQQTVNVLPQPIDRIQIQNTVQSATQTQASVRLSQPAPAGGLEVPLSSSDPAAASVPASVTVPAGSTQASFTVQTSRVAQNTDVTITAGPGQATVTFRVRAR